MIKVLQVFGALDCGGAETMLMNLYRKIDTELLQFDFVKHVTKDCFYDAEILERGGKIYSCPKYTVTNHFKYVKWWDGFFASHPEYKIIHSHVRSTASVILKVAKKHGLVTISHSHSTSNGKGFKSVVKKILQASIPKYSDYCFACSKKSGEWLFGRGVVESEKFRIIPNAIDTEKYKFDASIREEIRSSLGVSDKFVYGHVGRFHPAKNHSFLIDVFYEIHKRQQNSVLLLVGGGDLQEETKKKIDELSLGDSVIMLGVRSDVNVVFQAMDVFLFPSLWEGLPLTVVEAQAAGLPCFVSDTVTKEVDLSELVRYLPIDRGTDVWVKALENENLEHKNVIPSIVKAGFDINASVKELTEFYVKNLNP